MKQSHDQKLLFEMIRIRVIEEQIALHYPKGEIRCPTHLSIGQESAAAAFGQVAERTDFCVSTHRSHAHYLAKGGSTKGLIAELLGSNEGCSGGYGGSMHLIDLRVNFMGSTAIVGNSIPIGVGLGHAAKYNNSNQVSYVFIGDGATEEGVFAESANYAATFELPVVFICENNSYSVYTDISKRQPKDRSIGDLATGLGLSYYFDSGEDARATRGKIEDASKYTRRHSKPAFVEIKTFRHLEHCGPNNDDHLGYRTSEEIQKGLSIDPIEKLSEILMSDNSLNKSDIEKYKSEIREEIETYFTQIKGSLKFENVDVGSLYAKR